MTGPLRRPRTSREGVGEVITQILASFPSRRIPEFVKLPIPEIPELGRGPGARKTAIMAFLDTNGASNGPAEATNGVIETTRSIARGFRNCENYRVRNLLAAGGHRPYRRKSPNHA